MNKKIYLFIDVAKGIGIIAVMLGHIYGGELSKVMYMFHMPLFFIIGGFLFRKKEDKKQFLIDKAVQLMLPYVVFLFLIYSFMTWQFLKAGNASFGSLAAFLVRPLLGGVWLAGCATVFWFVPVFFLAQQLFNWLLNTLDQKKLQLIMLSFLLLAYLNSAYAIRVPWDINVVFMALPLFYLGYLLKDFDFQRFGWVACVISVFAIFVTLKGYHNYFDMKVAYYGIPIVTLVSALAIIAVVFNAGVLLSKSSIMYAFWGEIGKASMVIMYLHQTIQILVGDYLTSNGLIKLGIALGASMMFYWLVKRLRITNALFLGSKPDFDFLIKRNRKSYLI